MEIHYVIKKYLNGKVVTSRIEERNPELILNDLGLEGFKFCDEVNTNESGTYITKKGNYSGIIYFGRRLSLNKIKEKYGKYSEFEPLIKGLIASSCKDVCITQNGTFIPLKDEDMTYEESLKEFKIDKEKIAREMFEKLRKHIGSDVTLRVWLYGRLETIKGKLESVCDFVNVKVDFYDIPFVDLNKAIESISSKDEVLYRNLYVKTFYNGSNPCDVIEARKMIFGKQTTKTRKKKSLEIQKYTCIKEGLLLIKPETSDEWIDFVLKNSCDDCSLKIVEIVIEMMQKFRQIISFDEAEKEVYSSFSNLTSEMKKTIDEALFYFSKEGDFYKKHCLMKQIYYKH